MARFISITKVSIDNIKEVPEYKELFPDNNSYEELKGSIQQFGFLVPITVNKNYEILDGYTRYRIAKELGIKEIPVEIYETSGKEEELDIIASFNLKRRHLTKDQIITIIDKIAEKKKALKTQTTILQTDTDKISTTQESREIKEELKRLAPNVEINEKTIEKYLQVKKEVSWLIQYIGDEKKDKIGINKAYDIYRLLKRKNLLDLDKRIPKPELSKLITDKDGRKVLERDDLLVLILQHKMAVSQAINKLKIEKKVEVKKKPTANESKLYGPDIIKHVREEGIDNRKIISALIVVKIGNKERILGKIEFNNELVMKAFSDVTTFYAKSADLFLKTHTDWFGKKDFSFTNNLYSIFKDLINLAKNEIKIVSPWIGKKIIDDLRAAKEEKNLLITVVCLDDEKNDEAIKEAEKAGIRVIRMPSSAEGIIHAKVMIIDNTIALMGSANFTVNGLKKNVEAEIVTIDPDKVQKLLQQFDEIAKNNLRIN